MANLEQSPAPINSAESFGLSPDDPEYTTFGDINGNDEPVVDYSEADYEMGLAATENPIHALEVLELGSVKPKDIQEAINAIVPGSASAQSDSEVILGIAVHAAWLSPGDQDLDELVDRANKIYNREIAGVTREVSGSANIY